MDRSDSLQEILRRRYPVALVAGLLMWVTWLISLSVTSLPIGRFETFATDFLTFYSFGQVWFEHGAGEVYNQELLNNAQEKLTDAAVGPNIYPPLFTVLMAPFAMLPFPVALTVWVVLNLGALAVSLKLLGLRFAGWGFFWSLAFFPVFFSFRLGQNATITLVLLCLTYWLLQRRSFLFAGVVAGLLAYKPQYLVGVGLLLLVEFAQYKRAMTSLAATVLLLFGALWVFLPQMCLAYIQVGREVLPAISTNPDFLQLLFTIRSFFWCLLRLLLSPWLIDALVVLVSLVIAAAYVRFLRQHPGNLTIQFAGAIVATVCLSPHSMVYDWTLLIIPMALLWQAYPEGQDRWLAWGSIIWVVTPLGALVAGASLSFFEMAVHPAGIILMLLAWDFFLGRTSQLLLASGAQSSELEAASLQGPPTG